MQSAATARSVMSYFELVNLPQSCCLLFSSERLLQLHGLAVSACMTVEVSALSAALELSC
eukprot:1326-Heterococcus_DN1.PRE.2